MARQINVGLSNTIGQLINSTNTFSTNINSNVPTSGSISLNNFYGGRVS